MRQTATGTRLSNSANGIRRWLSKPPIDVHVEVIPSELRERHQWLVWRLATAKGGKLKKLPLLPGTRKSIDITSPGNLLTFAEAQAAYRTGRYSGIGLRFTSEDDLVGVDLDGCRDEKTGRLADWAQHIVDNLSSYTEVSPSGLGAKVFCRGKLPAGAWHRHMLTPPAASQSSLKQPAIEIYDVNRYFAVTGQRLPGNDYAKCEWRQSQLEALLHEFHSPTLPADSQPPVESPSSRFTWAPGAHGKYERLLAHCEDPPDDDRSRADFALCCEAIRTGRAKNEVWVEMQHVGKTRDRGRRYFEATWTAAASAASKLPKTKEGNNMLTNQKVDRRKKGSSRRTPLSMAAIRQSLMALTGGWPRRVNGSLFVDDPDHGIAWLSSVQRLTGWLHQRIGKLEFHAGPGYVAAGDLFSELQRTAELYKTIELFPHEPPVRDHYYRSFDLQPSTHNYVGQLLDRLEPATELDRDLILAAFVTPGWGGPYGARPAFLFTSDKGRGAGKSTLAKLVGEIWGGSITIRQKEDFGKAVTRLLSPGGRDKRIAIIDNVKSLRLSFAELEELITCSTISGHEMYNGEGSRPNTLCWYITLNGASLCKDMAQRCVPIKLGMSVKSGDWEESTLSFVKAHHASILGELLHFLRKPKSCLKGYSRWGAWEAAVLSRLPNPSGAQQLILDRQKEFDVEDEEQLFFKDYVFGQLECLKYSPISDKVFVPSRILTTWWNEAQNEKLSTVAVSRKLRQLIAEGILDCFSENKANSRGRGLIWIGPEHQADGQVYNDLKNRVDSHSSKPTRSRMRRDG